MVKSKVTGEKVPDFLIDKYKKCLRCGHQWITDLDRDPVVCPKCKRYNWNEPENE